VIAVIPLVPEGGSGGGVVIGYILIDVNANGQGIVPYRVEIPRENKGNPRKKGPPGAPAFPLDFRRLCGFAFFGRVAQEQVPGEGWE